MKEKPTAKPDLQAAQQAYTRILTQSRELLEVAASTTPGDEASAVAAHTALMDAARTIGTCAKSLGERLGAERCMKVAVAMAAIPRGRA